MGPDTSAIPLLRRSLKKDEGDRCEGDPEEMLQSLDDIGVESSERLLKSLASQAKGGCLLALEAKLFLTMRPGIFLHPRPPTSSRRRDEETGVWISRQWNAIERPTSHVTLMIKHGRYP